MTEDDSVDDPFAPKKKDGVDRRTFVKTAVGAAAIGAVAATGAGLVVPLSTAGGLNIRRFPYWGAKKIDGPAPQGLPLIPLTINAEGYVEGVPALEGAPEGLEHTLEWYRYCGHDKSPAFEPGFTQDNVLRYFVSSTKVREAEHILGTKIWYGGKGGQMIRPEDFPEVGDGAPFKWRSEGLEGNDIVTGIIIRAKPEEVGGKDAKPFMAGDLIAFSSYCAHFCCVPGYKETGTARDAGYFDKIYCTCHDSVYDPRDIKQYKFPPNM